MLQRFPGPQNLGPELMILTKIVYNSKPLAPDPTPKYGKRAASSTLPSSSLLTASAITIYAKVPALRGGAETPKRPTCPPGADP